MDASREVRSFYERFAEEYGSDAHATIRFMNRSQQEILIRNLGLHQAVLGKPLEEMRVLNIGVGSGEPRQQVTGAAFSLFGESLSTKNVIDVDVAYNMLLASRNHQGQLQVQADALSLPFRDASIDAVIFGLADHVPDQYRLYREAYRVLTDNGIFLATYPAPALFSALRQHYRIGRHQTRFVDKDRCAHLICSVLPDADALARMGYEIGYSWISHGCAYAAEDLGAEPPQSISIGAALLGLDARSVSPLLCMQARK